MKYPDFRNVKMYKEKGGFELRKWATMIKMVVVLTTGVTVLRNGGRQAVSG